MLSTLHPQPPPIRYPPLGTEGEESAQSSRSFRATSRNLARMRAAVGNAPGANGPGYNMPALPGLNGVGRVRVLPGRVAHVRVRNRHGVPEPSAVLSRRACGARPDDEMGWFA